MKTRQFFTVIMFLFVSVILASCQRDKELNDAMQTPSIQADSGDCATALSDFNTNSSTISTNLHVVEWALSGMLENSTFSQIVAGYADDINLDNDYGVLLSTLVSDYAAAGDNLYTEMAAALVASGGKTADVTLLNSILEGFSVNGQSYETAIFLPFLDADEFDHSNWNGYSAQGVTTIMNDLGSYHSGMDADGNSLEVGDESFDNDPIWIVGLKRICDDGAGGVVPPLRPKAQCWCLTKIYDQQKTSATKVCQLTASLSDKCGKATRTGQCSGTCN